MFRFTLRDVLWLTMVVALALGWWIDHRQANQSLWYSQRIFSDADRSIVALKQEKALVWAALDDNQRAEASQKIRNLKYISAGK